GLYKAWYRQRTVFTVDSLLSNSEPGRCCVLFTNVPGRFFPDIVIKKYKLAIFVDGEFWHGFQWNKRRDQIKSNRLFWIPKIERNMQKDGLANRALRNMGYTVFRF